MIIVKEKKKNFKLPIVWNEVGNIVAVGNLQRIDDLDISQLLRKEIENSVFEAELKYYDKFYTGYSTYVTFETPDGMLILMQNRGVLKLLELLCNKIVPIDGDGFIPLKFTFSKGAYNYYINPTGYK